MLVLTDSAAEIVKAITSTPEAPEGSGLRIASVVTQPGNPSELQLAATTGPAEDDQVLDSSGAHVFLEPQAAAYLDDKILDAQVDQEGNPQFTLGMQDPEQA